MASDRIEFTHIQDLTVNMSSVNLKFIVLDVGEPKSTKTGSQVWTIRVADISGSINLSVWDDLGKYLKGGDICQLINGYTSLHQNALFLNCGRRSELKKVGEFRMQFSETPFMSNPDLVRASTEKTVRKRPSDGYGKRDWKKRARK